MVGKCSIYGLHISRKDKVSKTEGYSGNKASNEDLDALRKYILSENAHFIERCDAMCKQNDFVSYPLLLLSFVDIRTKQKATLLGVTPQNLTNMRIRIYNRLTGK